uniref:uncharacterized protein LOC123460229 n=1 Tax=Jaculus jaculus TaxID=51337 RepID=UPI001E1B0C74|nr:uncharacterized protein LOC123460229 [Jaculus jaculus]
MFIFESQEFHALQSTSFPNHRDGVKGAGRGQPRSRTLGGGRAGLPRARLSVTARATPSAGSRSPSGQELGRKPGSARAAAARGVSASLTFLTHDRDQQLLPPQAERPWPSRDAVEPEPAPGSDAIRQRQFLGPRRVPWLRPRGPPGGRLVLFADVWAASLFQSHRSACRDEEFSLENAVNKHFTMQGRTALANTSVPCSVNSAIELQGLGDF